MTSPITLHEQSSLPSLIARATSALASATSAAEVLEARDVASTVYDLAKRMARLAKAKEAHDEVITAVYRAQADALLIESQAKVRLADEYDAAQERGEVQRHGGQGKRDVSEENIPSVSDIGLTRKQIHEARKIRDAEKSDPGITEKILNDKLSHGEEPTRSALKKEIGKKKVVEREIRGKKRSVEVGDDEWKRQQDDIKAGYSKELQAHVAAQDAAKAASKSKRADADLSGAGRIEELEMEVIALENENGALKAKLRTFERLELMFKDWTEGGWDRVVEAKDQTIAELQRTAQARIAQESSEKVRNLNAMRGLAKKLDKAGKGRDVYLDLDEPKNG